MPSPLAILALIQAGSQIGSNYFAGKDAKTYQKRAAQDQSRANALNIMTGGRMNIQPTIGDFQPGRASSVLSGIGQAAGMGMNVMSLGQALKSQGLRDELTKAQIEALKSESGLTKLQGQGLSPVSMGSLGRGVGKAASAGGPTLAPAMEAAGYAGSPMGEVNVPGRWMERAGTSPGGTPLERTSTGPPISAGEVMQATPMPDWEAAYAKGQLGRTTAERPLREAQGKIAAFSGGAVPDDAFGKAQYLEMAQAASLEDTSARRAEAAAQGAFLKEQFNAIGEMPVVKRLQKNEANLRPLRANLDEMIRGEIPFEGVNGLTLLKSYLRVYDDAQVTEGDIETIRGAAQSTLQQFTLWAKRTLGSGSPPVVDRTMILDMSKALDALDLAVKNSARASIQRYGEGLREMNYEAATPELIDTVISGALRTFGIQPQDMLPQTLQDKIKAAQGQGYTSDWPSFIGGLGSSGIPWGAQR